MFFQSVATSVVTFRSVAHSRQRAFFCFQKRNFNLVPQALTKVFFWTSDTVFLMLPFSQSLRSEQLLHQPVGSAGSVPSPIKREFLPFFPQKNSLSPFLNCILNVLLESHCTYIVEKIHASFADSWGMIKHHFIAVVDQRQWTFFVWFHLGFLYSYHVLFFLFNPSDLLFLSFLNCLAHQFFKYVLLFLIISFILFLTVMIA